MKIKVKLTKEIMEANPFFAENLLQEGDSLEITVKESNPTVKREHPPKPPNHS